MRRLWKHESQDRVQSLRSCAKKGTVPVILGGAVPFFAQALSRQGLFVACVLGLVTLLLGAGQQAPPAPTAPVEAKPLDAPLQLIAAARESYQRVRDYTCILVKREQLRGRLQPQNFVAMKVRAQPFSIYLRWLQPQAGQEACYVAGANNGMMRVHSTGLLGVAGFVSLDPRDPRALENSRHSITEAGIGNLIERFGERWALENQWNKTVVRIAEYKFDERLCTRVETTHPQPSQQFSFYRSVVYFDKEHHLPIRVENYDWPRPGSDPNGTLVESYSYTRLRLNVGVNEATFNR